MNATVIILNIQELETRISSLPVLKSESNIAFLPVKYLYVTLSAIEKCSYNAPQFSMALIKGFNKFNLLICITN